MAQLLMITILTVLIVGCSLQMATSDPHTPTQATDNLLANITLRCEDICSPGRCIYPVPKGVFTYLWNEDCEQEWFTQDGVFLADGSPFTLNRSLPTLVLAVTPDSLTALHCLNGLQYKLTCHGTQHQRQVVYTAVNNTVQDSKRSDHSTNTLILSFILAAVGAVVFLVVLRVVWVYCTPLSRNEVI